MLRLQTSKTDRGFENSFYVAIFFDFIVNYYFFILFFDFHTLLILSLCFHHTVTILSPYCLTALRCCTGDYLKTKVVVVKKGFPCLGHYWKVMAKQIPVGLNNAQLLENGLKKSLIDRSIQYCSELFLVVPDCYGLHRIGLV